MPLPSGRRVTGPLFSLPASAASPCPPIFSQHSRRCDPSERKRAPVTPPFKDNLTQSDGFPPRYYGSPDSRSELRGLTRAPLLPPGPPSCPAPHHAAPWAPRSASATPGPLIPVPLYVCPPPGAPLPASPNNAGTPCPSLLKQHLLSSAPSGHCTGDGICLPHPQLPGALAHPTCALSCSIQGLPTC